MHPIVQCSQFLVKRASSVNPNVLSALQGGLAGAGAGALVQGLRRMFQSRREEEEDGAPSILKGMLVGGGLGAAGGFGLNALLSHLGAQRDERMRQLEESSIGNATGLRDMAYPQRGAWAQHRAPYPTGNTTGSIQEHADMPAALFNPGSVPSAVDPARMGNPLAHPFISMEERQSLDPKLLDLVRRNQRFQNANGIWGTGPSGFNLDGVPRPGALSGVAPVGGAN